MSDNEEIVAGKGYLSPAPELDDHRSQMGSTERIDRSRRATVDSSYGRQRLHEADIADQIGSPIRVRDFEEVIVDGDANELSSTAHWARRSTVETQRSVSPPNSVKAFADARRREREMSFSEARPERKGEDGKVYRSMSFASRQSHQSRPLTYNDADSASLATNKSALDDVCYPVSNDQRGNRLHIDFDYLENFILADKLRQTTSEPDTAHREFQDLRHHDAATVPAVTIDGDFIEMPSDESARHEEKVEEEEKPVVKGPVDHTKYSFFSSTQETTSHAADLAGLVSLDDETFSRLFSLPQDKQGEVDGVWWLHVNNPEDAELDAICRAFGLHPLTIEDIKMQEAREKIEIFNSYYFACFRSFKEELDVGEIEFVPHHIYAVVFREGVLSFSFAQNSHAANVRRRITMLKDIMILSSDWICYALMWDVDWSRADKSRLLTSSQ